MTLFSFALIVAVDAIIKNELLTYALIVWGLVLLGRFILRRYLAGGREMKTGRNVY